MNDFVDGRARIWAAVAMIAGIGLYVGLDLVEDPDASLLDIVLHLLEVTPLVLTSVGIVILFQVTRRQRAEQRQVIHELETARVQGRRWRNEACAYLNGLGQAIDTQFSRWQLTQAEREVALLLLKGLSSKEVATVRATSERTAREQARSIYIKAGLTGRAALSAYFLEDLLAPVQEMTDRADLQ